MSVDKIHYLIGSVHGESVDKDTLLNRECARRERR